VPGNEEGERQNEGEVTVSSGQRCKREARGIRADETQGRTGQQCRFHSGVRPDSVPQLKWLRQLGSAQVTQLNRRATSKHVVRSKWDVGTIPSSAFTWPVPNTAWRHQFCRSPYFPVSQEPGAETLLWVPHRLLFHLAYV
jgi:hypothetical protein